VNRANSVSHQGGWAVASFQHPTLCLACGQASGYSSITGWFLLRGASGSGAVRVSSWGWLLQCHHHPGAETELNGTHTSPLAADWPHVSTSSHTASSRGEMPFMHRAGLQTAGRQASEGAAHSPPPPPSSLRGDEAPAWTSHSS